MCKNTTQDTKEAFTNLEITSPFITQLSSLVKHHWSIIIMTFRLINIQHKQHLLLELCFEFGESRPLARVVRPTLGHQAVQGGRALRRHGQSLPVLYPANHVIVLHSLERLDAVHQDLPHTHTCRETHMLDDVKIQYIKAVLEETVM